MERPHEPAVEQFRRAIAGHAEAMAILEKNVRNWMNWIVLGFLAGAIAVVSLGEGAMGVIAVASVAASSAMVVTARYVAHDGTNAAYMAVGVESARWLLQHGIETGQAPDQNLRGAEPEEHETDRASIRSFDD